MFRIFHGLQALLRTALRISSHSRMRQLVAVLGGLVLAITAPQLTAKELPLPRSIDRTTHGAAQVQPTAPPSGQESRVTEPQETNAPPQSLPLASEQTVSRPPQVSYEDGQLTIIAENSSLSDILSAVRRLMGADIDLPASLSGQRIWVRLGPGPARRVLAELLSGTELNYVIQASDTDVDGIQSVLLTLRSKTAVVATVSPGTSNRQLPRSANRNLPQVNSNAAEVAERENPVPAEPATSSDAAPTDPPSASTGSQSASTNPQPSTGAGGSDASQPVARTSEQMIQQLQSMYQQRRQQMIQQSKPQAPN